MRHHCFRQRQPGRQQKRRPVHAMKARNLFPDHVQLRRPELLKPAFIVGPVAQRCDVIRQRIEPDVDDVRLVTRHRDAPLKAGARNR